MLNFGTIETSIVAQLAPLRSGGLEVRALPDNPQEYGRSLPNGEVLVKLLKKTTETGGNNVGLSGPSSLRSRAIAECIVTTRLRNLRDGSNSGWLIVGTLEQLLNGFVPTGASGAIAPSVSELVDREDQWWVFQSVFIMPVLSVVDAPEGEELPRFVRGCFTGNVNDEAMSPDYEFDVSRPWDREFETANPNLVLQFDEALNSIALILI